MQEKEQVPEAEVLGLQDTFPIGMHKDADNNIKFVIDVHPPYVSFWLEKTSFTLNQEAADYLQAALDNYIKPTS